MGERKTLQVVSATRPAEGLAPPVAVLLSEPMRRFRCNQKGCCCSGWDIPFRLEDLLRLDEHLPESERAALRSGVRLVVDAAARSENGETLLHSIKFDGVGEGRACRFLEPGGACRVHASVGLHALPDLCVDFPVFPFRRADGAAELWFDPVCPEVLAQLAESDAPLELVRQDPAFGDPMMDLRVAHAADPIAGRVGDRLLELPALDALRRDCVAALAHPTRPIAVTLAMLLDGFSRLPTAGSPGGDRLALDEQIDPAPFLRFLWTCIGAHGAGFLAGTLAGYRRFVFALDLEPVLARPDLLERHLTAWPDAFARWLSPAEDLLRPLALRWLAHRFGTPMTLARAELRRGADCIVQVYGLSLRYAAALGAVLGRPVDKAVYVVALGAAEACYRGLRLRADSLPWFASAQGR